MKTFVEFTAILIGIITAIYLLLKWKYSYWQSLGVKNPKPAFLVGNAYDILTQKISFGDKLAQMYNEMKANGEKHFGMYFLTSPMYVPIDPEITKLILQKDFQCFQDRGVYFNEEADPLSAHLFSIEGDKWKNLRAKITPAFTSSKMKIMFSTVVAATESLVCILDGTSSEGTVEVKDILARLTTDIIGSCAFGIECNSLKDPNAEFRTYGKKFIEESFWKRVKNLLSFVWPNFMRLLRYKLVDVDLASFFMRTVQETVEYRESTNYYRKDFIQLMLELKNNSENIKKISETITFNEIAAQAFVFFVGGFETSSSTMTFCLYELCLHQEIQVKLRNEINKVLGKHGGEMSYDALADLHYMEMVIEETLRKYPIAPVLNRICNRDYPIPGFGVTLKKGTKILIPAGAMHHDPEYYPNAHTFDPERFTEENKVVRNRCTYIPFGEGPRICIGLRFGMMQVKVGLSVLLKNYKFTLSPRTAVPLKMDPGYFFNTPLGGVWMNIEKVK